MYSAEVAYQDELVGSFIKKLRDSGRLDNTLLIVVADHGEHLGEKLFIGHSITLYNELIHVPLIIRDPRNVLPRGTEVPSFVSTRRIFHTVLEVAGIGSEAEHALTLAQNGDNDPERDVVFSEGIPPSNMLNLLQRRAPELVAERGCDQVRRAVYSGSYKLIKTGESQFELYDVLDDPHEETNLRDILPEQVELMQEQLEAFLHQNTIIPTEIEENSDQNDPQVNRRLHDLGYLE
jgi:arylsulfatase A-like enzyme